MVTDTYKEGTVEAQSPQASSKDTGRMGPQPPRALISPCFFLCLPPTAHPHRPLVITGQSTRSLLHGSVASVPYLDQH